MECKFYKTVTLEYGGSMEIHLFHGDIGKVRAEGLVCPVDGAICVLGGPAAAKMLKESFDPEERDELFGYLEEDVKKLCPIPHGEARVIPGEGNWDWLIVVAAIPHHVNDEIISQSSLAQILERSISNGIRSSVQAVITSLAMTVIGSSYRLPAEICVQSAVAAIHRNRKENQKMIWCFLDEGLLNYAAEILSQHNIVSVR